MALPALATTTDLSLRGATISGLSVIMLDVASCIVRGYAGSPIAETTSTVDLTGWGERSLTLPGLPIQSVSAVTIDDTALGADGWKLTAGSLWRYCGWGHELFPVTVGVTMVHGLPEVPSSIVQLVCDLAIAGEAAAAQGAIDPRVASERIDDYTVTFVTGAEAMASAMELPKLTRTWLRSSFGGGAGVVSYR